MTTTTTPANVATKPAFIRGLIYRSHDGQPYPGATSAQSTCYSPAGTGNWAIADCWVCDENGRVDPGFNVSAVPVCKGALGAVIAQRGLSGIRS